jgi:hypothetical protein
MRISNKLHIWASTGVLLLAAAVLFSHADDLSMWFDELWSMFQNSHPLSQIIRERELNWPVGYAVTLHGWTSLISSHDFVVHILGVLIGMLGVAFMIQAGRALHSEQAGWLAGLAYGTSGYTLYFFLEARGYGMQLMLAAALICFMARWVRKPIWYRAVPYALAQIALLYTHFSSGLLIAITAVYIAIAVPYRLWWRWIVIMAATGIGFLPLLHQFWDSYNLRSDGINSGSLPSYFLKGPESIFHAYSVYQDRLFALILLTAGFGLIFWLWKSRRKASAAVVWLLLWGVGVPIFAYITRETQGLFTSRYLSFTIPAVILLIGLGLAALPRQGWIVGAALLLYFITFPWHPFDHRTTYPDGPPVRDLVREMAQRMETGDALIVDPSIDDQGYDWWYYEPLYFPGGSIPRATDGYTAGSRVWYLTRQGSEDPDLRASVEQGRIRTDFWGPWYFIATLYQSPPLSPGVRVGDNLYFRGRDIPHGSHYMPGDDLTVRTWWSVSERPDRDYSIGVQVIGPQGNLIAQSDGGPMGPYTPEQTSGWEPGQVYRDDRSIKIPYCLPPGDYQIWLVVYYWEDQSPLVPQDSEWSGPDNHLLLDTVMIDSFSYCDLVR